MITAYSESRQLQLLTRGLHARRLVGVSAACVVLLNALQVWLGTMGVLPERVDSKRRTNNVVRCSGLCLVIKAPQVQLQAAAKSQPMHRAHRHAGGPVGLHMCGRPIKTELLSLASHSVVRDDGNGADSRGSMAWIRQHHTHLAPIPNMSLPAIASGVPVHSFVLRGGLPARIHQGFASCLAAVTAGKAHQMLKAGHHPMHDVVSCRGPTLVRGRSQSSPHSRLFMQQPGRVVPDTRQWDGAVVNEPNYLAGWFIVFTSSSSSTGSPRAMASSLDLENWNGPTASTAVTPVKSATPRGVREVDNLHLRLCLYSEIARCGIHEYG